MKSVKVKAAIKPKCAGELSAAEMHLKMEKYRYDLNWHMPEEEMLEYLRYHLGGYEARHLQRVREGRAF